MIVEPSVNVALSRVLNCGGFADRSGGAYSVDATVWSIIGLTAGGHSATLVADARERLTHDQLADGRVPVVREHAEACWPTSLSVLAWTGSTQHREAQGGAVRYLLQTTGAHSRNTGTLVGHDMTLRGWPWVAGTHSWVEPTALSVIALRASGYGRHDRVEEAERMLLDRQLTHGGWNYGNTIVIGKELHPNVVSTGAALCALVGRVDSESVAASLSYLRSNVSQLKTPMSLGWALLGLSAWGRRPSEAREWISECLQRQTRYGEYRTAALGLLLMAASGRKGFEELSRNET